MKRIRMTTLRTDERQNLETFKLIKMDKLTQGDVLNMTKQVRKETLDYYEDLCCNTDYVTNEIEYSIYARNCELLISKIEFNEY